MSELEAFWRLFRLPLGLCVPLVLFLGAAGLHVLDREIIFIDLALAQIAALGGIAAHMLAHAEHGSAAAQIAALGAVAVAALFYAIVRRRVHGFTLEATIGISYGLAAAGALLLLGTGPGGHLHVQAMLSGSLLWVRQADVVLAAVLSLGAACFFLLAGRPFEAVSKEYENAVRSGMHVVAWDFLFYLLLGLVVTTTVRLAGVVVVFCLLILPALFAVVATEKRKFRLVLAWSVGLFASAAGMLFSHVLDFSAGPSMGLVLLVLVGIAALWRRFGAGAGAPVAAAFALGLTALVFGPAGGGTEHLQAAVRRPIGKQGAIEPVASVSKQAGGALSVQQVQSAKDVSALSRLFEKTEDPEVRCAIVARVLDLDPQRGLALALRYLKEDPPLFFRGRITDRIKELTGGEVLFDPLQPFGAAENQEAALKLRRIIQRKGGTWRK